MGLYQWVGKDHTTLQVYWLLEGKLISLQLSILAKTISDYSQKSY